MELDELSLLLVEPSNTQRRILVEALKNIGLRMVRTTNSVANALAESRSHPPHVVLSAMHLPDGKGSGLLAEIRADPDLESIAFLLVSSETRTHELEPIRQGGAVAIIPKPCSETHLLNALGDTLDLLSDDGALELESNLIEDIRVLVVDDSKVARRFIIQVLTTLGVENIVEAEDGLDGAERMQEAFFDLVVTDYNMPRMDGYQFVEYIRQQSNQPSVPVLMVTSEKNGARIAGVERAGVSAIVDKPFEIDKVRAILGRLLD